ncbi:hypothetical protein [Stieleria neptunia]|uniref:hypothetical protein n=1 Tax=Stieleria neptunia TaxID=2527979 RepID=UPI0011AAA4B9|nr:hypothetical protein [Stieleria neptunia]
MTNPYAPSTVEEARPSEWTVTHLNTVAGSWLIVFGLLHFFAINLLSQSYSVATAQWTPLLLTGLGVLVAMQFRIAIALTRLISSFTIVGLVFAGILLVAGFGNGGELTYGNTTVTDPTPWQLLLLLATIAATMIPPWALLQRAAGMNHRQQRRARLEQLFDD